ncbi:sensor histidine kinase [Clostridium butyricum]|uniref:sensor histidine kinase n=1 Tax=Clostridium butyricum TaxID=1492 RepID=UPI002ABE598C|nr:HAMP domain-containing sensor histidine kinase [Clostridium butyricum]
MINQLMDSYQKERITVNREQMARKQLLANISHDVRTPLASVIGYLEAVILGVVHNTEKDVYLDIALKKSYDLKQRVDLLFELVRLDANEIHFNREKSDICELVRSVIIDFIPIVEKNDIILQVKIPDKEYFADVDVSAFTRVVQNLIRNALTHGKSGFYLGVKVYLQGKNVCIDIIDHGDGISKKDITFIFDRLYQGDTSRTQNGGLGLAIVYEIIKKMEGTISVDSNESKYTVFTVQLPLLE